MTTALLRRHLITPFVLAASFVACGGKISGVVEGSGAPGGGGVDSGVSTEGDAGTIVVHSDATACVDVNLDTYSQACVEDTDCTLVRVGEICSGECSCGDTPINASGLGRYSAQTSSVMLEGCPCAFPGNPRCIAHVCTLCGLGPDEPAGCSDAGTTTPDDGGIELPDSGETDPDSGVLLGPDAGEAPDAGEDSLDGTWNGTWTVMDTNFMGTGGLTLQLTVQGSVVSGTATFTQAAPCFTNGELTAMLAGAGFDGTIVDGASASSMNVKASVTGNTMTGGFNVSTGTCAGFFGSFTATR